MSTRRLLRGSCSCGRNNYIIAAPENAADSAYVFFDGSSESRRAQAAPVTAWLHFPLTWFRSHTTSFFPDETHSMIRKTFTPIREPHSKRNFCGFCGTNLTYWSENPEDEGDYLNVTIGSLFGEDLRTLGELGFLPDGAGDIDLVESEPKQGGVEDEDTTQAARRDDTFRSRVRRGLEGDMTWMEEMIDGSRLGRSAKTRRGVSRNADATTTVEWEITEIVDEGSEPEPGARCAKRKLGDIAPGDDAHMQL